MGSKFGVLLSTRQHIYIYIYKTQEQHNTTTRKAKEVDKNETKKRQQQKPTGSWPKQVEKKTIQSHNKTIQFIWEVCRAKLKRKCPPHLTWYSTSCNRQEPAMICHNRHTFMQVSPVGHAPDKNTHKDSSLGAAVWCGISPRFYDPTRAAGIKRYVLEIPSGVISDHHFFKNTFVNQVFHSGGALETHTSFETMALHGNITCSAITTSLIPVHLSFRLCVNTVYSLRKVGALPFSRLSKTRLCDFGSCFEALSLQQQAMGCKWKMTPASYGWATTVGAG